MEKKSDTHSDSNGKNSRSLAWKALLIGSLPDALMAGGGYLYAKMSRGEEANLGDENNDLDVEHDDSSQVDVSRSSIPQASGVNDEMSFSEAFSSARQELGAE